MGTLRRAAQPGCPALRSGGLKCTAGLRTGGRSSRAWCPEGASRTPVLLLAHGRPPPAAAVEQEVPGNGADVLEAGRAEHHPAKPARHHNCNIYGALRLQCGQQLGASSVLAVVVRGARHGAGRSYSEGRDVVVGRGGAAVPPHAGNGSPGGLLRVHREGHMRQEDRASVLHAAAVRHLTVPQPAQGHALSLHCRTRSLVRKVGEGRGEDALVRGLLPPLVQRAPPLQVVFQELVVVVVKVENAVEQHSSELAPGNRRLPAQAARQALVDLLLPSHDHLERAGPRSRSLEPLARARLEP
mmetsp:Transcript_73559/g.227229  ORF Transcript_73559/g.227229 Transcript_73559/m.227229 type:complete len:299 (-) Transcript_73559:2-898(-)